MNRKTRIGPAEVRALASCAELPLAPGREELIAETLDAWVAEANELSRKMSAAEHRELVPATVFTHPEALDGE